VAKRSGVAIALGVVLGFVGSRLLFLQAATLIPWGIAGLVVGAISQDRRQALVGGAAYGFVVGFTFTAAGYGGADPLFSKIPFFAIFGLVSAAFGIALSLVGHWLTIRLRTASGGGSRQ
jgi:hypothetical protein